MKRDLHVESQVQVIHSSVDLVNSNDLATNVRFEDVDSAIGSPDARVPRTGRHKARTTLYGAPTAVSDLACGTDSKVSRRPSFLRRTASCHLKQITAQHGVK